MTTTSSDTAVDHAHGYSMAFCTQILKLHLTEEVKLNSATVTFTVEQPQ